MRANTVNNCKILIGCFVIEVLINGAVRLSSIYFVESLTRYNVDRNQASFPFVMTYMVKNVSGPFVGYFEQILGTKWIITIGCLMATLAIGGCFFAEDILVITLLWGLVLGLSFEFAHIMQAPLINQCFTTSKSKANGFVSSGSCVGGALLPAITVPCIQYFGTSGSFLVLSAIVAHTIPASLLIHTSNTKPKYNNSNEEIDIVRSDSRKNIAAISEDLSMDQTCKCLKNCLVENASSKNTSVSHSPLTSYREKVANHIKATSAYDSFFSCTLHKEAKVEEPSEDVKQSFFNSKKYTFRHFRIFTDPPFIAILFVNGLNTAIITTMWTIILDFVKDKGVPENLEIYYVIVLPITDLIGRIGSGYLLDKAVLTVANFCLVAFLAEAVALAVIVFFNDYIILMVLEILISFFIGLTVILDISITHEFMKEGSRKMAMSSRFLFYVPISFAISPMIGYFRSGYGSYDNVFYIMSVLSLFCGCAAYLLPHLAKSRRAR